MVEIKKLNSLKGDELTDALLQIREIFFLSTSIKEFSSLDRKEAFFKRWCGDFIALFPEHFYLMMEGGKLLGYLSGCLDSAAAKGQLEVPGYLVFEDLFGEFPAHLHINFHPDCRGRGLGSLLVNEFCKDLSRLKITGVHLVTSPGSQNVSFYSRLGFKREVSREFNSMSLLFMGKIIE